MLISIYLFKMIVVSLIACCLIMLLVWLWAVKIKNASVVDIFWSFNFPVIGIIVFFMGEGWSTRKLVIAAMVIIWGSRLGFHLLNRILSHLDVEEGRYQQLRKEWAPNPDRKFFYFFQMQAVSNVFLAIPFFIIASNTNPKFSFFEIVGVCIWIVSILGEATADWQLQQFKKNSNNKGKVCESGLWNYSRHPNYFFEWLIWVAYFVFALGSNYGWISIVCPAIMLYLLFKVTGIPMTEEQSIRSKGEAYKQYQKTTSVFVPWIKRN